MRCQTIEVIEGESGDKRVNISDLCRRVEMTRQNYYADKQQRRRREVDEGFVVALVQRERQLQPRLGGRKLCWMLGEELESHGVQIGRDRFFEILRDNDLLIEPRRSGVRTTMSRHSLPVFGNLIKNVIPTGPHQIWVSDLTYIRTMEGFMYGALITDKHSRKIVGNHLGDNLESVGCQMALKKAMDQLPEGCFPIHHSDRGCQYCCHEYVDMLRGRNLAISMTEEMHCYENAMAERVNGILKLEYGLDATFKTKQQAREAFEQAIWLYNERRPHLSLDYQIPSVVHAQAA